MENRYKFAIIAFLLGGLGIQEFFLGNNLRGVLGILFCWTGIPAIVAIVQLIIAIMANDDDEWLAKYPNNKFVR